MGLIHALLIDIGCLLVILFIQSSEVGRAAGWSGQPQHAPAELPAVGEVDPTDP